MLDANNWQGGIGLRLAERTLLLSCSISPCTFREFDSIDPWQGNGYHELAPIDAVLFADMVLLRKQHSVMWELESLPL